MATLKLGTIESDKPVKLTIALPAPVHRDLVTYAQMLAHETGQNGLEPAKLIPHMLARFMATDRGFAKARKTVSEARPLTPHPPKDNAV